MSAGFPGMGAMPGQTQAPQTGITFTVAPDANWEPFDQTDVLEKDGYYCAKIVKESGRADGTKTPGVFFQFEIQDPDAVGKRISKFMPDPNKSKNDTWWLWRSIMRSIMGTTEAGKAGFQYTVGCMLNQLVYVRTGQYRDDNDVRTGVDAFILRSEWEEAAKAGKHRWAAKAPTGPSGGGVVGALPGGLPSAFPGGGMGLPGAPMSPGLPPAAPVAGAPVPGGAPMQQPVGLPQPPAAAAPAPVASPFGQPAAAPPAPAFPSFAGPAPVPSPAALPPPPAPAPAASPFAFSQQPTFAAPANGAPQPPVAAPAFPGMPGPNGQTT